MSLESSKRKTHSKKCCGEQKHENENDYYVKTMYDKLITVEYIDVNPDVPSLNYKVLAY